jgi:hypothetical protein
MKAKEMFEALGYYFTEDKDKLYEKAEYNQVGLFGYLKDNKFGKEDGVVFFDDKKYTYEEYEKSYVVGSSINFKLHQAIHQQMKELGWIK